MSYRVWGRFNIDGQRLLLPVSRSFESNSEAHDWALNLNTEYEVQEEEA